MRETRTDFQNQILFSLFGRAVGHAGPPGKSLGFFFKLWLKQYQEEQTENNLCMCICVE